MKKGKAILLSAGIAVLCSGVLLSIAALVVAKMGVLPQNSLSVITILIGSLAVFIGGFFSSMCMREKGMLLGLLCGAICSALVLGISFFLFQIPLGIGGIGKISAFLVSGCLGGIMGVNRKKKVKF